MRDWILLLPLGLSGEATERMMGGREMFPGEEVAYKV